MTMRWPRLPCKAPCQSCSAHGYARLGTVSGTLACLAVSSASPRSYLREGILSDVTDTAASPALHGDHLAPLAPSRPPLTAVRRVGILYQTKRLEVIALAREVEQFLRARDVEVIAGAITLEEQIVCQE